MHDLLGRKGVSISSEIEIKDLSLMCRTVLCRKGVSISSEIEIQT